MSEATALLEVRNLAIELDRRGSRVRPVADVSFEVAAGEAVAVLGESGSGKTLTALSLLGLLPRGARPKVSGVVRLDGVDLTSLKERQWRDLRGKKVGMVFQDPLSAMNPAMTVGRQISELYEKRAGLSRGAARAEAVALMERVRIPAAARRFGDYPHQFSGGMRQRAMIAMALALGPKLIIADEPTTALDVTVQAEILELLAELRREARTAVVLISHDLGVVSQFAERVVVMYAGRTAESGAVAQLLHAPQHPYTRGLRLSVPRRHSPVMSEPIPGAPPDPADVPSGCAFNPRCTFALPVCHAEIPPLRALRGALVACHRAEELGALD